jgi:hypothetical protein
MSIESKLGQNRVRMSILIRMAFLFPILPFLYLGAEGGNRGAVGAAIGLVVGILAGGFCCGLLVMLRGINDQLVRIAANMDTKDA